MQTVLVTGGAGYIGSHVCKCLHAAGFLPVVVDNFSQGHRWAVRWGPLVEAAIDDQVAVAQAIRHYKPLGVIHLASSINVRDSIREPLFYYQNNVMATLRLLETLRQEGVRHFVFSSSAAVYGQPKTLPIREEHEKMPLHPYGRSKLMVEELLRDLSIAHGMRFAALRYFNAAGADPDGEIGEAHNPETHLIPLAILSALGQRGPFKIYGRDFPTSDGTAVRDYIHVTDLAEAHLASLLWIMRQDQNLTLNLGTGQGYSVQQVLGEVGRVVGKEVPVEVGMRVPEDPTALVADPSRAKTVLGWEPRYSDLDTIIETALAWHSKTRAEFGIGNGIGIGLEDLK